MALTPRLQQATLQFLAPKYVEGALSGNTGMGYFLRRAKKWRGSQETVAFKYAVNPNGGSFLGMDTLSANAVENGILLTYDYKPNYISTVLPNSDIAGNETEQQVADLMERMVTSDQYDLARILGIQFYGDGTGNSGKDILGLGAIVDDKTTSTVVSKLSYLLETLVKPFVLMPVAV